MAKLCEVSKWHLKAKVYYSVPNIRKHNINNIRQNKQKYIIQCPLSENITINMIRQNKHKYTEDYSLFTEVKENYTSCMLLKQGYI